MATEGIIPGNALWAGLKGPRIPGLSTIIKELILGLNFGSISIITDKPRMAPYRGDQAGRPAAFSAICKGWGEASPAQGGWAWQGCEPWRCHQAGSCTDRSQRVGAGDGGGWGWHLHGAQKTLWPWSCLCLQTSSPNFYLEIPAWQEFCPEPQHI